MANVALVAKKTNKPTVTYRVEMTDDSGTVEFGAGYSSPLAAAKAIAGMFPEIDASEFAATWNAYSESSCTQFTIGDVL